MSVSIPTRCLYTSRLVARAFPFRSPIVLLLSYPRSGSSWVGAMLSHSPDVAYLREPVTQPYVGGARRDTVVDPEADPVTRRRYARLADRAFAGVLPWRLEDVVENVAPFSLRERARRTLVIKEVNPLAARFYTSRYRPKIVLLFRHPAAVAESYERMGWLDGAFEELGGMYGAHMAAALDASDARSTTVVRFEDLARDPREGFRALFTTLGFRIPDAFERLVEDLCETEYAGDDPYATKRVSRDEAYKWRERLSRRAIDAVMRGYRRAHLRHYRDDDPFAP